MSAEALSTIPVREPTRAAIRRLRTGGQSYDDLIRAILEELEGRDPPTAVPSPETRAGEYWPPYGDAPSLRALDPRWSCSDVQLDPASGWRISPTIGSAYAWRSMENCLSSRASAKGRASTGGSTKAPRDDGGLPQTGSTRVLVRTVRMSGGGTTAERTKARL